jgi:L-ascorbate metabolism protein UlaG (beta-lactamase superfamily)
MIISKHSHSCLLIKEANQTILIDPGNYTYEDKALDISSLEGLDYILITHEHPDHMYIPFMKELVEKFPDVKIISNESAVKVLKEANIEALMESSSDITISPTPHERVFGVVPPENIQFSLFNKLTHPGDSLHFLLNTPILALPLQAPWCSLTEAVEYAMSVKPKIVIPIHDWHWNESAREAFYARLTKYFGENGIEFNPLRRGEEFAV